MRLVKDAIVGIITETLICISIGLVMIGSIVGLVFLIKVVGLIA